MLQLNLPGKRREEALSLLRPILHLTRAQAGCWRFDLLQDLEASDQLWVLQEWDSDAHLQSHLRSKAYESMLAAMEIASEPPLIRFSRLEEMGGMDTIRQARLGSAGDRESTAEH